MMVVLLTMTSIAVAVAATEVSAACADLDLPWLGIAHAWEYFVRIRQKRPDVSKGACICILSCDGSMNSCA